MTNYYIRYIDYLGDREEYYCQADDIESALADFKNYLDEPFPLRYTIYVELLSSDAQRQSRLKI